MILVVWAFFGLIGGFIGYLIGQGKGQGTAGFWLGFFLGAIGWVIVAVMDGDEAYQQAKAARMAAAIGSTATAPASPMRVCPHCAETVKAAASICRYCHRELDPVPEPPREAVTVEVAAIEAIAAQYPAQYPTARRYLDARDPAPRRPDRWLEELCRRMEAGSPPAAAAERIPLDFGDDLVPTPTPVIANPSPLGDYPAVAAQYPNQYDEALATMYGLAAIPTEPQAWLRELCRRMEAGSPSAAAAARIPLAISAVRER